MQRINLIMEIKLFDHIFLISNYEVIDYYNNEEVNKLHSQILISPQDIKEYFEWLFIKGKHYFCGHPGGLFGP